jgi:hypothetical protein
MTEQEWLGSTDPVPMLEWIGEQCQCHHNVRYGRMLHRFGTACLAGKLDDAHMPGFGRAGHESDGRIWLLVFHPEDADDFWYEYAEPGEALAFVRDIFGNPFRPVALPEACLTPAVRALAQAAYAERGVRGGELDLARLAVLADALEEVGADGSLLEHLRGPGPHVRGCWVVALVLEKG